VFLEEVSISCSVPGFLPHTPRLAPFCAGVSPGNRLAFVSSAASLSGAFVATSGSAMFVSGIVMEGRNGPIRDGASKEVLHGGASINEGCSKYRQLGS